MADYEWLDADDVAKILRKAPLTTARMLNAGKIRNAKVGRRRLVRRDWLDQYLESLAEGGRLRPVRRRAS